MCWLWSAGSCVQPWNSLNWFRIFFYVFWQKNSTSKAQKVGSRVPCYCLQRLYTVISRRAYVGAGLLHRTETEARLLELRTRALPFLPQPIPQGAVCFFSDSIFYVKPTMRLFNGLLLKFILNVWMCRRYKSVNVEMNDAFPEIVLLLWNES